MRCKLVIIIDLNHNMFNPLAPPLPKSTNDKLNYGNLVGSELSLVLTHTLKLTSKQSAPLVVITESTKAAIIIEREIRALVAEDLTILSFPDFETLPYDTFSVHQDLVSERLKTLSALPRLTTGLIIIPITSIMHKLAPVDYLGKHHFYLKVKDKLDLIAFKETLIKQGYIYRSCVTEHGEFTVRGSLIDIFPMGSDLPYRLDLFDNEIESIRSFSPTTQLSLTKVETIEVLPGKEFPLDDTAIATFRAKWRQYFSTDAMKAPIYTEISKRIIPGGIEYYLPLFFHEIASFFDYLPKNSVVVKTGDLNTAIDKFNLEINYRYEQYRHDIKRPILPPAELFFNVEQIFVQLKQFAQITTTLKDTDTKFNFTKLPNLSLSIKSQTDYALKLKTFLAQNTMRILFCVESQGRKTVINELFKKNDLKLNSIEFHSLDAFLASNEPIGLMIAAIDNGFILNDYNTVIIAEAELYGNKVIQRRNRNASVATNELGIRHISELEHGSAIVHLDHGVGRYLGLQTLNLGNKTDEYLTLVYANDDKIYVPVSSINLISKYSGVDEDHVPLHKLGTDKWDKDKKKAQEKAYDVAATLLNIYSKREITPTTSYDLNLDAFTHFCNAFPFEETPDQQLAIDAIINDLHKTKAMDRLVCGDVGFGKTEVAMRAAFMAVQNKKQVAVLVPTTLLAEQHFETFHERFAQVPVIIESLSRFKSKSEQNITLNRLSAGKIDIIIGTHRLLQDDIKFKDLGLLIIDEEHRFGVTQKEKLKSLRAEVHILTLTATPIPRTLNLAVAGLRDLSIIATPPAKRLSIKTFMRETNDALIHEAIMRELMRGGQIYYLHNKVETIEQAAHSLRSLIPEAKLAVAHGQMHTHQLEQIMFDFYHQKYNVLVCSTIIENGIDVPSANTIIIKEADKFGLAQLHQLRGRVGRSHHQAYAYLLIKSEKNLSVDAKRRLEAICAMEELGSGFNLATQDLEIRGCGEILGEDQSGNIQGVGFTLYLKLLEKAVYALQHNQKLSPDDLTLAEAEVNLNIPAFIPDNYLPDVSSRLILYKRIAVAKTKADLDTLRFEMIDRFGMLPQQTINLFAVTALKLELQEIGAQKLEVGDTYGIIEFNHSHKLNTEKLIKLIQLQPKTYKLLSNNKLKFNAYFKDLEDKINYVYKLIQNIS